MKRPTVFVDRRRRERRRKPDPCSELPLDLYHRKRRKSADRRSPGRTLAEDYQAFMATEDAENGEPARHETESLED